MNKHAHLAFHGLKLAALVLAVFATGSATGATTSATSTSIVVTPISITKAVDLSFGTIAGGGTSGTVTLTPGGTRTLTGGAVGAGGAAPTAAQFTVNGAPGLNYSIDYTGTSTTLTSGSDTMAFTAVSDTTASGNTSNTVGSGTLRAGGTQTIYVGGVLTVGVNQNAGTYTGNISVAVNYN